MTPGSRLLSGSRVERLLQAHAPHRRDAGARVPADTPPPSAPPRPGYRVGHPPTAGPVGSPAARTLDDDARTWGGRLEDTPFGPVVVRTVTFPAGAQRGGVQLDTLGPSLPSALPLLLRDTPATGAPPRGSIDPAPGGWAVLDTETTGLAGGAGTFPFLVGVGLPAASGDAGGFELRQYLAAGPAMEAAVLWSLDRVLAGRWGLITFNGKAFDLPLLEGRRVLQRQPPGPAPQVHLDLRYVAARLWRGILPDTTLMTLEQAVLKHTREDDIPGPLIPASYFTYLRSGDPRPLAAVFRHNEEDVLTLAALTARVAQRVGARQAGPIPGEWLGLARLYAAAGAWDDAAACARLALEAGGDGPARERAAALLARASRRLGRPDEAAAVWEALAAAPDAPCVALVEWAKHCEHRRRDLGAAAEATRRALDRAGTLKDEPGGAPLPPECAVAALRHRLGRLERRRRRIGPPRPA